MKPLGNEVSKAARDALVDTLNKSRFAAIEAIMRDGHLSGRVNSVGWNTVDTINTDPSNSRIGSSWLAAQTIGDWLGPDRQGRACDESTVRRAWSKLIERGHIVRMGRSKTVLFSLPSNRAGSRNNGMRTCSIESPRRSAAKRDG